MARRLIGILLAGVSLATAAADTVGLAPGYGELGYSLPEAGSYALPSLGLAADGEVLDADGQPRTLHSLFADRYVLLAFIYSSCSDINGCPLTAHVFYQIKSAMKHDSKLARELKLISLSFDPQVDTPKVMALYGNNFRYAGTAGEWQFITTRSEDSLRPILRAYGQDVQRDVRVNAAGRGGFAHVLRVFLIDPQRHVRNIYSAEFLHQDLVLNDVRTLMAQSTNTADETVAAEKPVRPILSRPGDDKRGYGGEDYRTDSRSLLFRQGRPADLFELFARPPLGLPEVPVPADNPMTASKIALGRRLFYDRRLSLNDTFSCAMCHVPEQGFTSNELAMAVGIEGRSVRRNTPTVYNAAYARKLFHDGRESSLEQQVWGPLLAVNEMGNPSVGYVLDKIRGISDYDGLFEAAFNGRGAGMETLGMALASYQRTLLSANSPFDRWRYGGEADALSDEAKRGFALFQGKAGCSACHTVGENEALFTDDELHNTGVGYRESMGLFPDKQTVVVAPGVSIEVDRTIIEQVGEKPMADVGRYEVTQNPMDRWKYKTPSLRNIALTAPYMHNGSMGTLRAVVDFYDDGGVPNELLDPRVRPLGLSESEKNDLVAFLESLTGSNVDELVADAFAAPVGDVRQSGPDSFHAANTEANR